jgi:hypothetical protein
MISWIRKGKLKVWKRVGHGSNAALLFERRHIEELAAPKIQAAPLKPEGDIIHEQVMSS